MRIVLIYLALLAFAGSTLADVDTLWIYTFGASENEEGCSLEPTLEGGFLIGGLFKPFPGMPEFYMIKTDLDGVLEWENTYPGSVYVSTPAAVQLMDSTYVIAGTDGDMPWCLIHAIRTDMSGDVIWNKYYSTVHEYTSATCITRLSMEIRFVLGGAGYDTQCSQMYAQKTTEMGACNWGCFVGESTSGNSMYGNSIEEASFGFVMGGRSPQAPGGAVIAAISPEGSVLMDTSIGKQHSSFNCAREVSDGSLVAAGYDSEVTDWLVYMAKFNIDGETLWEHVYDNGDFEEWGSSFVQTQDGGYMMVGTSADLSTDDYQVLLMKVDDQGELEHLCRLGDDQRIEYGQGILEITPDVFVLMGTCENASGDDDIFLMKLDTYEMGITPQVGPVENIQLSLDLSPNPCSGFAGISLTSACLDIAEISVYDCSGRIVRHLGVFEASESISIDWNTDDDSGSPLPPGIYTVVARSGQELDSGRLVILR